MSLNTKSNQLQRTFFLVSLYFIKLNEKKKKKKKIFPIHHRNKTILSKFTRKLNNTCIIPPPSQSKQPFHQNLSTIHADKQTKFHHPLTFHARISIVAQSRTHTQTDTHIYTRDLEGQNER